MIDGMEPRERSGVAVKAAKEPDFDAEGFSIQWGSTARCWAWSSTTEGEPMKPLAIAGALLTALDLVALVYKGITNTSREADIGPVRATAERERNLPLPTVLGITAVAAGVMLLVVSARRSS